MSTEPYKTSDGVEFDKLDHFWVLEKSMPLEIKSYDFHKYQYHPNFSTRQGLIEYHIKDQEHTLELLNKRVKEVKDFIKRLKQDESINLPRKGVSKKKSEKIGNMRI